MDLGLASLTDDQLVDLLDEACRELSTRAWFVREAAQRTITSNAQKLTDLEIAIKWAVGKTRDEYLAQLKQDVLAFVQQEVQTGNLRVMTPEEEAKAIASKNSEVQFLAGLNPDIRANVINAARKAGYDV